MVYTSPWFHCRIASVVSWLPLTLERSAAPCPESQASLPSWVFTARISLSAPASSSLAAAVPLTTSLTGRAKAKLAGSFSSGCWGSEALPSGSTTTLTLPGSGREAEPPGSSEELSPRSIWRKGGSSSLTPSSVYTMYFWR